MEFSMVHSNETIRERTSECLDIVLQDVDPELAQKIRIVCYEALTNAIQANLRKGGKEVRVTWYQFPTYIRLNITDEGGGFDYLPHIDRPMPEPDAEHGRGIPMIRKLADYSFFLLTQNGTRFYAMWNYAHG